MKMTTYPKRGKRREREKKTSHREGPTCHSDFGASARMTVGTRWGVLVFFLNGSRHSECSKQILLNQRLFIIGRVVGGGFGKRVCWGGGRGRGDAENL